MRYFTLLVILLIYTICPAQYSEIQLDYDKSFLGQNQELPAETDLLVSGKIPATVAKVQISIYPEKGRRQRHPLYEASWKRPMGQSPAEYSLPIHYRLRGSTRYDILLTFFEELSTQDQRALKGDLTYQMEEYLKSQILLDGKEVNLNQRPKKLMARMEELLQQKLANYQPGVSTADFIFTDLFLEQLIALEACEVPALPDRRKAAISLMTEELSDYLSKTWYVLVDDRYLDNVPTESTRNGLSINAGFGGIGLGGDTEASLQYDVSPYLGISFPLGNSAFSGRFFSNLYVGAGVLLNDLERDDGTTFTGPVIGRPIYASLDYKLFQFVYVNAGATLLEREGMDSASNTLLIRPFIGLSAKINLSIGFDK